MPTEQEALKAALGVAVPGDLFAIACLQLCQVSYFKPLVKRFRHSVQHLPRLHQGGSWQLVWGPVQSFDEANLVYVATYFSGPDLPVFTAVVIRGTDVDVCDPLGILEQIWEDADVLAWGPMPWDPTQPARISNGSIDALSVLQGLQDGGQTLESFLASYLTDYANDNPALVVTGHSLGGCLVSVVAPWLKSALAADGLTPAIIPTSFAGPTAGNKAFADYFNAQFPHASRYWNTLDVVPRGWWDLSGISAIYEGCGLTIPDMAYCLLLALESLLKKYGLVYSQPLTNGAPLTGACMATTDWYTELACQHHTTTYMSLLGGKSIVPPPSPCAPTNHRMGRSSMYERFGPISTFLRR